MNVADFIQSLPADWAMAPIYKRGYILQSKEGPQECCGKRPMQGAWKNFISPAQAAHKLRTSPDVFGACGVYAGARSGGVVVLDVDERLGLLEKAHGEDLKGPRVDSPKRNAAKFFFRVPEQHWNSIEGVTLKRSNAGWEILWTGKQAIVCGDYKEGGEYTPSGDFSNLPEIPMWMLGAMQEAHAERAPLQTFATKKGSMFRAKTTSLEIARDCLKVIPDLGAQSRQEWVEIGFMIHDELPCELGLQVFTEWSRRDPHYADEWEAVDAGRAADPCAAFWKSIRPSKEGGLGFGSLIKMADLYDPKRERFPTGSLSAQAIAELESETVTIREQVVSFEELYDQADEIFSDLDMSTAERRFKVMALAARAGIRIKPVQEVTEMYLGEREKRMGKVAMRTAVDRYDNPAEASYFVPGILCSGVWLVSGRGNSGKTNAAWRFAKHFLSGMPLKTTDGLRTWEKGPVLWLSGDQPDAVMDDQIKTHLTREECENLYIENNFNINDYPSFLLMAQKYKPKFVVIDSLRSCHRGTGVTENDSEFALPLRWYEQMMGQPGMFESCMIFVIHHSGHGRGGARGTSALGDMTSFTADFDVPGKDSNFSPLTTRVMTLRKHRFGLKDHQLLAMLQDDGTVDLNYIGIPAEKTASSVQDRVRLKLHRAPKEAFTVDDLASSAQVAGSKDAVRKAIHRLIRHGLVVKASGGKGRTTTYQAAGVVAGFPSKEQKSPNKIVPTVTHSLESQSPTGKTQCDEPCPITPMSHLHTSDEAARKFLDE